MFPPVAERPKLRATLDQLSSAVEDLLLGGLTTASDATRQTLAGAMQEAARMRLLRSAILRVLADDLNRFNTQDPLLSRRRLTLFLNRGWLIARGLSHALETNNEKEYDRLNLTPTTQPLATADMVCLGVVKKVTAAVVQFQFRFRSLAAFGTVKNGDSLVWSFSQASKNKDIPPETYLHLAQKQKFTPASLIERKIVTVKNAVIVPDEAGGWKIALNDQSTITQGAAFTDWERFLNWNPTAARERLAQQKPGPLDLDTELQEEVVLSGYAIGQSSDGDEPGQIVYPITAGRLEFRAIVGAAAEGKALRKGLDDLQQAAPSKRTPLYGLMHYERCRLVLQALTTFGTSGPNYLTISPEKVDKGALLRELF